ncbi:basic leucine-zipper 42 [Perilla frutescens var. hirtella]|uniref:Basic leucine-zipper 42 n=1 Tax=Perilla frutescens var. hirtella TaxID=608512 RepID=A0AAD4IXW0_PERFH|nr:basic leucine-zipper 42 [Perilla frutescens var. frutescens]KAH6823146.1 basic leucine-zipper 42 [Perilla frutescens var. hirtella]
MIQQDFQELNYFSPENLPAFPANFGFNQSNSAAALQYSRFLTNLPNYQTSAVPTGIHEFSPNSTCNSTSDEAEDPQLRVIDERKQRRMISNRESARRSRMRKQRHLDELWSQVLRLRTENHSLIDKLNHVSESHDRVVQENARLKEEASDLRQMLTDLQITNSYTIFRDLDDIPCNTAHLRAESSTQSVTTSTNLLH